MPSITQRSNRMRNVFVGILLLAALIGGAWWAAQRFLRIDAYRQGVIDAIEAATGMPCTIETMAIHFVPDTHVLISGVDVGDAQVHARVGQIRVQVELPSLLRGTPRLPSILLEEVEITFADGEALPPPAQGTTTAVPGVAAEANPWIVGSIEVPQWRVKRGESTYAEGSLRLDDPLGAEARFTGDARVPGLSPQAAATLEGSIARGAGSFALAGQAMLQQVDLAQAVGRADLATAVLDATVEFSGNSPQDIAFSLDGNIVATGAAEVAGKVSGKAWWRAGEFIANDLTWDTPGLRAVADATRKAGGDLAVEVREAKATKNGLALLLSATAPKGLRVDARESAQLTISDLLVGRAPDGAIRWVRGKAALKGLDLTLPPPEAQRLENISASARIEEGTLVLESAALAGFNIAGRVTPTGKAGLRFDLNAKGDLSNPLLASQMPASIAQGAKGSLDLKRISGTWDGGAGLPCDLVLEGSLADAVLQLETNGYNDTFNALAINFSSDGRAIVAKARANATTLGAVSFDGRYDTAAQTLDGTTTFSGNRLAGAFATPGLATTVAQATLAAYRDAEYRIALRLPAGSKTPGSFTLEKTAAPAAKVHLVLLADAKKGGVTVGEMSMDATLPLGPAAAALPWGARGDGAATVSFHRTADARFDAKADLKDASLAIDPYLAKAAGAPLSVRLEGQAGETWQLERVLVDLLGQPLILLPQGDGFASNDLALDLAGLMPLFPSGSEATGTLRGSVATQPLAAALHLDGVRLKTPGGMEIDQLDGDLRYAPDAMQCKALRVAAYGSDVTLDGKLQEGTWRGSVRGPKLDLNAVFALFDAQTANANAGPPPSGHTSQDAAPGGISSATVDAEIDTLIFRKANIADFRAQLRKSPEETMVDQIQCAPAGGNATGSVSLRTPGGGSRGTLTTRMDFKEVDLRLLDEISSAEPRGMSGPASGTIDLTVPTGPGVVPTMGLSGEVVLSAHDGSLGKAGASGKVLAALRTTELAQLQIPSLRDRGLSFTSANAHVLCREGVVTLEEFNLAESTHTMTADGVVDFPGDTLDLTLRIQLLQNVRDVVALIPLFDRVAQAGGIYLYFKGSPSDPKVSSARIRPLQEIRQQGGGLVNGLRNLINR